MLLWLACPWLYHPLPYCSGEVVAVAGKGQCEEQWEAMATSGRSQPEEQGWRLYACAQGPGGCQRKAFLGTSWAVGACVKAVCPFSLTVYHFQSVQNGSKSYRQVHLNLKHSSKYNGITHPFFPYSTTQLFSCQASLAVGTHTDFTTVQLPKVWKPFSKHVYSGNAQQYQSSLFALLNANILIIGIKKARFLPIHFWATQHCSWEFR